MKSTSFTGARYLILTSERILCSFITTTCITIKYIMRAFGQLIVATLDVAQSAGGVDVSQEERYDFILIECTPNAMATFLDSIIT